MERLELPNAHFVNFVHPYMRVHYEGRSCDDSVGVVTGYALDGHGSINVDSHTVVKAAGT
jgi:hypothetical protein